MIFLLLVGFLTYITATDEPDDSVNDFAEFETEGDEEEEEETETHGTSDQDEEEEEEGLIKSKVDALLFIIIYSFKTSCKLKYSVGDGMHFAKLLLRI